MVNLPMENWVQNCYIGEKFGLVTPWLRMSAHMMSQNTRPLGSFRGQKMVQIRIKNTIMKKVKQ